MHQEHAGMNKNRVGGKGWPTPALLTHGKALRIFVAASICLAAAWAGSAGAFVITGQLTGDIRADNPDGLVVDVTITSGQDGIGADQAQWVIDINSDPPHAGIRLHQFYFNLTGLDTDYGFTGFDPTGWDVDPAPSSATGAGGANFLFETADPPGNANNVTNAQNLTFLMNLTAGSNLTEDIFLNASNAISNDAGQGQMGAHLGGLTVNNITCPPSGGCDDSGFAFGSYEGSVGPPPPAPTPTPAPTPLALMGLGGILLGWMTRKSRT